MVYMAAHASLTVLEVLVHLDVAREELPSAYRLLTIDIPDTLEVTKLDVAPRDNDRRRDAGDAFLREGATAVLSVPSVIVPQERNLLLNPLHMQMRGVRVLGDEPFEIDPRLMRV